MKPIYISVIFIFSGLFSFGQSYDAYVENVINAVNLDSLVYQLRNLSGEDPVVINGETTFIEHRVSNWGNSLAASYLYQEMGKLGLEAQYHTYSLSGQNVYAIQEGTLYPDEYIMICAHYDAVDYVCADDNASGCAAVIEAARIFKDLEFEYSIIYAFWDEEEIGLIGSEAYAVEAASNGDIIHSVINMDMISWDSDMDMVAELHSSYNANSIDLADYMVEVNSIYGIEINPVIELPGTTYSDHSSFWNHGYPSVLVIEEYYGGDFNPYYHTEQDQIDILNMPYFHAMSKLSIASLASKAEMDVNVGSKELRVSNTQLQIFPNPASHNTRILCQLDQNDEAQITLLNNMGQMIAVLYQGEIPVENYQINLPLNDLSRGIYFVKVESEHGVSTEKLMVN